MPRRERSLYSLVLRLLAPAGGGAAISSGPGHMWSGGGGAQLLTTDLGIICSMRSRARARGLDARAVSPEAVKI